MRTLLIIVAAVTACTLLLTAPAARAAPGPEDRIVVDVDFPGGTIEDYVARIHRQAPDANILVQSEARGLPMDPVRLRQVDIELALGLLNQVRVPTEDGEIRVDYGMESSDIGTPVHQVVARHVDSRRTNFVPDTTVLAVADILDSGLSADDLLAAVEVGLSLYGDEYEPLQIRFHEPTGILIARGHARQIGMLHELVASINDTSASRADRDRTAMQLAEAMQRAGELEERVRAESEQRQALEVHVGVLRDELAQAQAREHDFMQQIQQLDRELNQVRTALDRAVGGRGAPN